MINWALCIIVLLVVISDTNGDTYKVIRTKNKADHSHIVHDCDVIGANSDLGVNIACDNHQQANNLKSALNNHGVEHESFELPMVPRVEDISAKADDDEEVELSFLKYPSFKEVENYLKSLAEHHPSCVNLTIKGHSRQGRPLYLIKIGSPNVRRSKAVLMDGGLHAREWISPATVLFTIKNLVKEFESGRNSDVTKIDWYFFPLINPDGYHHSMTVRQLWRKNMYKAETEHDGSSGCDDPYGVDLNRNFDVDGFGIGASNDICSDTFMGPKANSEPETITLSNFIMDNNDIIKTYIAVHSFSQIWLTSYGYTYDKPADDKKMRDWAKEGAKIMTNVNGATYTSEGAGDFYLAGGASDDYAKRNAGIPYVATIELRPGHHHRGYGPLNIFLDLYTLVTLDMSSCASGLGYGRAKSTRENVDRKNGFKLPPSQIISVGKEFWAVIPYIAKKSLEEP